MRAAPAPISSPSRSIGAGGTHWYGELMQAALGLPNEILFAQMLASQRAGDSALPTGLGLSQAEFDWLMARHFPGIPTFSVMPLDVRNMPEYDDILHLLLAHRAGLDASELWMAMIVTAACLGKDHLWQDLGLWSRKHLTQLMTHNFPSLAAKNVHDMKWKKFLYKQLCEQEGIQACRSPSCQSCVDYGNCFGAEE